MRTVYQFYRRTIGAGATETLNVSGSFLEVLTTTGAANIRISIDNSDMQELPSGVSLKLPEGEAFTQLQFYNSELVGVVIELAISAGDLKDSRLVLTATINTKITSNTFTTPAALAVAAAAPGAAAIAADSTRYEAILTNVGANPVWAGDANVDGANNRGILIAVNQTVVLTTEAAIWLRSTGGASTVAYALLKRI